MVVLLPDGEKNFKDICYRLDSIAACDGRTDRHLATTSSALRIRVAR